MQRSRSRLSPSPRAFVLIPEASAGVLKMTYLGGPRLISAVPML